MDINALFEKRKYDPRWNTSYPLSPKDWAQYHVSTPLTFAKDRELSFYIHVPFCKQLCSFCEYTRMVCNDETTQHLYIEGIAHDIELFRKNYSTFTLRGFDIGGGTPTALSNDNFEYLLKVYKYAISSLKTSKDYEPSIEATFDTLSDRKIYAIVSSGIFRLSLGIQTTAVDILGAYRRKNARLDIIKQWMSRSWRLGIKKINLDLMYGLKGQIKATIAQDLSIIEELEPQQVTLYELRTNQLSLKEIPSKVELFCQYEQYYDGLIAMGYKATFGQNTFSKDESDTGVSSYLRSRMLDGVSYKGFGLSAQSMSKNGVSYNVGKFTHDFRKFISKNGFPEEDIYCLPPSELASKYIAIAAYNGSFSLNKVGEYFGYKLPKNFQRTIAYCTDKKLMIKEPNNRLRITRKGFLHFGAVFSLFMTSLQKESSSNASANFAPVC